MVSKDWPFDEKEARRRQKAVADALRVKVEQEVEIAEGAKMAFVLIPACEFLMGSPPTTSQQKVAAAYGGGAGPEWFQAQPRRGGSILPWA